MFCHSANQLATCKITKFTFRQQETPDENPFLDKHPAHPNIVIGAGFSGIQLSCRLFLLQFFVPKGHGFKLGPVIGKILSELVLDLQPSYDLSPFKINRLQKQLQGHLQQLIKKLVLEFLIIQHSHIHLIIGRLLLYSRSCSSHSSATFCSHSATVDLITVRIWVFAVKMPYQIFVCASFTETQLVEAGEAAPALWSFPWQRRPW